MLIASRPLIIKIEKEITMAVTKQFTCEACDTTGKITLKGDLSLADIVYCPVCGASIYDEDLEDGDED